MVIGDVEVQQNKEISVLVGRFLTDKNIIFNDMQNVMASLWRPREGVVVHHSGDNLYLFIFTIPWIHRKYLKDVHGFPKKHASV